MPKVYKIKVVPRAKQNKVEKLEDNSLKVWLTAPPVDNKANFLLLEVLAKYLNIKQRQISIISGVKSRDKQIKIDED
ncbi:MAG: DUF167 domain-containing protein [Candidatus Komeilibacteria bacterium]